MTSFPHWFAVVTLSYIKLPHILESVSGFDILCPLIYWYIYVLIPHNFNIYRFCIVCKSNLKNVLSYVCELDSGVPTVCYGYLRFKGEDP